MLKLLKSVQYSPYVRTSCPRRRMASNLSPEKLDMERVKNQNGMEFDLVKSNSTMEEYYYTQKICNSDDDWQACLQAMRKELPQSFRINSARPGLMERYKYILSEFGKQGSRKVDINQVSWGDRGTIWQLSNTSRWNILEKQDLKSIHEFVFSGNGVGDLSRQELVSMVPVLLLDILSHHKVLDMCSSPGSKTKQVAEYMMRSDRLPEGVLISNEFDVSRCDKLSANLKRLSCPHLILVNQDGQSFPEIYHTKGDEVIPLRYDRIVCDVPCSGDGTIRKNPNVWLNWSPAKGNSRHTIQYNIAERGVELLEVGGLMAYSSCSINPVENEAVVGRLLSKSDGALELVDCQDKLPGLNYYPGQTYWKVFGPNMEEYKSYDEVPENLNSQIRPSHWPPKDPNSLHLERCMRFLPHLNDDGGFFVAILKKTRKLPWEGQVVKEKSDAYLQDNLLSRRASRALQGKVSGKKIVKKTVIGNNRRVGAIWQPTEFFNYYNPEDVSLESLLSFYGLDNLQAEHFYSSAPEKSTIYFTNPLVKDILKHSTKDLNLFSAGTKVFQRESRVKSSTSYKLFPICGECLVSRITKRVMHVEKEDVLKLLQLREFVAISEMSKTFQEDIADIKSSGGLGQFKIVLEEGDLKLDLIAFAGDVKVRLDLTRDQVVMTKFLLNEKCL